MNHADIVADLTADDLAVCADGRGGDVLGLQ